MRNNKYKNKYRIESARLKNYDYRKNGSYFITICTKNREHFFGEIENDEMNLSKTGIIADVLWYEIANRLPNISLGEFVIMPNHIHGILNLNNDFCVDIVTDGIITDGIITDGIITDGIVTDGIVETLHATSLPNPNPNPNPNTNHVKNEKMAEISPKPNSISTIIRSYKSAVTKHANRLKLPNGWQPRFHDHIIRNEEEYVRISNYIRNNPKNWKEDRFFL